MTYKKTWLSYLLWAVYTCLTGVMLANYAILFWQKKINAVIDYGTVLFVLSVFGMVIGIYLLIRYISGRVGVKYSVNSHTKLLWEIFIALSIFFAGLLYRISLYLQNINDLTETSYYQLATVKADDVVEPIVHGASYLYTMCLSFVLSFLGNKITAAVWMQILIQMTAILLVFFVVRRLAGRIPACIAMFVLAVSSVYAGQILVMTPESLFFVLYLAGIFIVCGYVRNVCQNHTKGFSAFLGALLSGFIIGFLTYMDAISLTLFIFLPGLVTGVSRGSTGKKQKKNTGFSVLLIFSALVAGGLSFAGMLALNAYSYYVETEAMAEAWFELYRTHLSIDYVLYRTEYSIVECFILAFLAFLLTMTFWNRKKEQNATPWFLLMFLLAPTPLAAAGVLDYQVWSVFLWSVLAGIGIQQSLVREEPVPVKREADMEYPAVLEEELPGEDESVSEKGSSVEPESSLQGKPSEKPRFLENPLPLPKKHEKRTMDYQYEVAEDKLKFDIEIEDDDDFDVL